LSRKGWRTISVDEETYRVLDKIIQEVKKKPGFDVAEVSKHKIIKKALSTYYEEVRSS